MRRMSVFRPARKKPVVIDAVQLTAENIRRVDAEIPDSWVVPSGGLDIRTLEGVMHANLGDWVICGVSGEFYPCKPDIFEQTYELVLSGADVLEAKCQLGQVVTPIEPYEETLA